MDFWDTKRGHYLADVLINALPQLAQKRVQYAKTFETTYEMEEYLVDALAHDELYVQHIIHSDGSVLLIMEKRED